MENSRVKDNMGGKSQEEKIDDIHEAVITIKAKMEAKDIVCVVKHEALDKRITGLHDRVLGEDGLESKHDNLEKRFDRFENKAIAFCAAAVFLGQLVAPYVMEWIKK